MKFLNDEIYEIYKNIKHAGTLDRQRGNVKMGTAGILGKGDFVQFQIQIVNQQIEQVRYKVHGTPATIACCELLACAVEKQSLKDAISFDPQQLIQQLQLPRQRQSSAMLAVNALRTAIGIFNP